DDYVGEGYGAPTAEGNEAIMLAARTEGLVLDPVYTGKALAGLIAIARRGGLDPREVPVFVHTGGAPIGFAYHQELVEAIARQAGGRTPRFCAKHLDCQRRIATIA